MRFDKNQNTIVEVGDTILTKRKKIGIIKSIDTGYEDDWFYWEALVYYPEDDETLTTYLADIDYILTEFKFN